MKFILELNPRPGVDPTAGIGAVLRAAGEAGYTSFCEYIPGSSDKLVRTTRRKARPPNAAEMPQTTDATTASAGAETLPSARENPA